MKKLALSVLLIVIVSTLYAQEKEVQDKKIIFGVKAGLNVSTVYGDLDYNPNIGFYIGGLADFVISKKIHIQQELLYSMEGFKDSRIGYLRLPIMAKYYISKKFNVQLGATTGLKTNANNSDGIKSLDIGPALGCSYELPKGLTFDFRYNVGLNNINNVSGGSEFKNSALQLGIGFRF